MKYKAEGKLVIRKKVKVLLPNMNRCQFSCAYVMNLIRMRLIGNQV